MDHKSSTIRFKQNTRIEQRTYNVPVMCMWPENLALAVFLSCDHMPHTPCWTSLRFSITSPTCRSKSACMTYYQDKNIYKGPYNTVFCSF